MDQKEIHRKGFDMTSYSLRDTGTNEYGKIKVGVKSLEDATLNLSSLKGYRQQFFNKGFIMNAIANKDIYQLREISDFFYGLSGIYSNVCNYASNMYRYDWYIVPEVFMTNGVQPKKENILKDFVGVLNYFDDSHIKNMCEQIALKVIRQGCYYGYEINDKDSLILQELPVNYCRSRYFVGDSPVVEFNMRFFDDTFRNPAYRMKVLKMFPEEFAKGYILFKQGKLVEENDTVNGWYLLDPKRAIKFSFNNSDIPLFINAIPAIIDLDAAQELDRRKQMQNLLKIIVQKLPMDKNGDLLFDVDEAIDIHNNAVEMLKRAIGVDVLTTFTDVEAINTSDRNSNTTQDDLAKVERGVYNSLGISKNLFNSEGNLALTQSVLEDESTLRNLLHQFQMFFDKVQQNRTINSKKYRFRFYMLETTQYNYREMSKLYKEQVQLGYSKMLPQIALGHSQSMIINTAYFENEILSLNEIMVPPQMSSTMSGKVKLDKDGKTGSNKTQNKAEGLSSNKVGRPEKPDDQKSDKTLQNKESM